MPRVARQSMGTRRISVDGRRRVAKAPSLATSWTLMPAPRAIFPPPPGRSSTLWMTEPTGMKRRGRALPGRISAPWPDWSRSPDLHLGRGQDVALLAVEVVEQGDAGIAVGVVLDGGHLGRHPVLVPLEVDDPVLLLVAAAAVAGGLAAVAVAPAGGRLGGQQGLLRAVPGDLGEVRDGLEAPAGAGGLA